jgi:16S rRNA (guanine527-N7)-methyltransferase
MDKLIAGARKLGLQLNPRQIEQFSIYYQELVEWNKRVKLTAITDYEEVQIKHFLDSLTVTLAFPPPIKKNLRIIDVGTGAGLPGTPLKIVLPEIELVLLDATTKKARFLHHLKQKLGLDDIEIVVGRAEEIAHQTRYREKFDITLSRAVAGLPALVELTLPFCAVGGRFIAQKKAGVDSEMNEAAKAIHTLGGRLRETKRINLAEFGEERWLIVIDKIAPTPSQYPRRPGLPGKRPIV